MAFQPADETVLVEFKYTGVAGQEWQNNLHFQKSTFGNSDINNLCSTLFTTIIASDWWDELSMDGVLTSIVGTDLRTEGAYQRVDSHNSAGGRDAPMAPIGAGPVVTLRTDTRGRSFRGRVFLTGRVIYSYDNGQMNAETEQDAYDLITDLQTAALAYGFNLCVLSRWHDSAKRTLALPYLVTSHEVRNRALGSQRRRNERS